MIGIRALAEHLNMSIGTVSRALNGRPGISEQTRRRAVAAAKELGYVPNQSGRSLRQGTTNAVGFMIELDPESASNIDNFFMGVFDGVKRSLNPHGLDLVVLPCATDDDPVAFLKRIVGRRLVDAVILSATQLQDARISVLLSADVPFIALGRSQTSGNYPWIDLDVEWYVDTCVDRLVAFGHRRIAIALPESALNLGHIMKKRFLKAMARHKLDVDSDSIVGVRVSEGGGIELANVLLSQNPRPSAVILAYELFALGLYSRMEELGLKPGRDLSIIGLRESPQSRSLRPVLTSFRVDLAAIGAALAEGLTASMPAISAVRTEPVRKLWPMQLVPGDSDGPL